MAKDLFTKPHPAIPSKLSADEQQEIVSLLHEHMEHNRACRPWVPVMRNGFPFRVKIFSFGRVGWTSDRLGYRYLTYHPETFESFTPLPGVLGRLSERFGLPDPDTCLVNLYDAENEDRLGLHQDNTEKDLESPIISVSLGASCVFLLGGRHREDNVEKLTLASGDVLVLGGERRLAWHGVERILPKTGPKDLLESTSKRVNLTFRRVFPISL